ncbi:hypothetical protein EGH22_20125 [Halomicroarcula sp. F28]|uniref:hypothetical protein n=1 Tax=Haloarcula salinisoli TaxID=2487746 RepID=UPI001C733243|nr:hypothetical protein [Halomicroarcula salinisoli]MBX0288642.1 hypothetical protein [Halomicroarcula salinisoli]
MTDGGQRNLKETLEDIDQGGRTAAELQRQLDTDEFQAVYDADLPDDTRNSLLRAQSDGDLSAPEMARAARSLDGTDNKDVREAIRDLEDAQQRNSYKLVGETGDEGAKLINELDQADGNSLRSFTQADLQDADMTEWRSALARRSADPDSAVKPEDVAQYARDVREIQRLTESDSTTINNPNRVVQETIENPGDGGQILGQQLEARRTVHYARNNDDVTVDPNTPGNGEPDLRISRGSGNNLYVENKIVEGDLDGGLKVKDKIIEADGSFDGISSSDDSVVEINAQGDITNDFNANAPGQTTARESFKDLVRAQKDPAEGDLGLPTRISGYDNPDMTVRIIDQNGNVVEGGGFSIRAVYQEV